ncbi:MAG TPA: dephospho-CoA kinase [Candidatus Sulfotelmatobacter sp.]
MLRVGLTGGIASGKSVVGEMLVALGAQLIQADRIAHQLMQPGQDVYAQVVAHFGGEILNPDQTINRSKLAEAAFAVPAASSYNTSRIEELNRLVHPAVVKRQNEWMDEVGRSDPHAIAVVEAALILEAGAAKDFDRLIVVTCGEDQRAARFAARQNISLDKARREVERRMAAQMPDSEKIKAADFVIDNSGHLDQTREQVALVWKKLRAGPGRQIGSRT